MLSGNAATGSRVGPAGPAALLLLLVTLTLVAGDRIWQLESSFYDFLQRKHPASGSDKIVMVNIGNGSAADKKLWEPARFHALIDALNNAGATSIVPVEAPPANTRLPNFSRLAALVELEERSRKTGDSNHRTELASQLESFRRQYEDQAAMEAFVN